MQGSDRAIKEAARQTKDRQTSTDVLSPSSSSSWPPPPPSIPSSCPFAPSLLLFSALPGEADPGDRSPYLPNQQNCKKTTADSTTNYLKDRIELQAWYHHHPVSLHHLNSPQFLTLFGSSISRVLFRLGDCAGVAVAFWVLVLGLLVRLVLFVDCANLNVSIAVNAFFQIALHYNTQFHFVTSCSMGTVMINIAAMNAHVLLSTVHTWNP